MNKIGIIGAGTKALPPEVLRMTEEANVEIVELDKDYSPTDTPQFEDRVYTIQSRPEIPHIEWCEPVRFGKGGSKSGRSEKQIRKDRKKNKARKTYSWNFPEEIRGFSLDIRIYPLPLLRQSIKTIKS